MEKNLYQKTELDLIFTLANFFYHQFPLWVSSPRELISSGYMALQEAKSHYHTGRGAQFKTYASRCIHHAMMKEIGLIRNMVTVPEKQRFQVNYVALNENNAHDVGPWEDTPCAESAWELELWKEDQEDRQWHQYREVLEGSLDQLDPSERDLIRRRYGFDGNPWTFQQLGEARGVSPQAIHKQTNRIERGLKAELYRQCA